MNARVSFLSLPQQSTNKQVPNSTLSQQIFTSSVTSSPCKKKVIERERELGLGEGERQRENFHYNKKLNVFSVRIIFRVILQYTSQRRERERERSFSVTLPLHFIHPNRLFPCRSPSHVKVMTGEKFLSNPGHGFADRGVDSGYAVFATADAPGDHAGLYIARAVPFRTNQW